MLPSGKIILQEEIVIKRSAPPAKRAEDIFMFSVYERNVDILIDGEHPLGMNGSCSTTMKTSGVWRCRCWNLPKAIAGNTTYHGRPASPFPVLW